MSLETLPRPTPSTTGGTPDLVHAPCCCDEDVALCGLDVSAQAYTRLPLDCIVCVALQDRIETEGRCGGCCPLLARKEVTQ